MIGPTYLGQSVGRWQGRTLIVDSIGFMDTTLLDASGLPHSDALHLTEKYTPSRNGEQMTLRITIDNPKTYAQAWETQLELKRNRHNKIREDNCLERKHIEWGKFKQ